MRKMPVKAALAGVAMLCGGACSRAAPPSPETAFVGTWQLVSLTTEWPGGRVTTPWGSSPIGHLSYGADGRMSAQLMDAGRNQADGRSFAPEFAPNVASYFGTFSIDTMRRVVRHRVAASIRAAEAGTLERLYELRGDTLVLRAAATMDSLPVTHTLVWLRGGSALADRP